VSFFIGNIIVICYGIVPTSMPQFTFISFYYYFLLQAEVVVSISEKLFIGGDLNGHVGFTRVGFDGVHGGFGYGSRNQEGEGILNFVIAYDLIVANTLFRKRVSHLVTFSSGQHCSQIDFILVKRG
jgi:hypothetical protein